MNIEFELGLNGELDFRRKPGVNWINFHNNRYDTILVKNATDNMR